MLKLAILKSLTRRRGRTGRRQRRPRTAGPMGLAGTAPAGLPAGPRAPTGAMAETSTCADLLLGPLPDRVLDGRIAS